jgi:hypothetical protein
MAQARASVILREGLIRVAKQLRSRRTPTFGIDLFSEGSRCGRISEDRDLPNTPSLRRHFTLKTLGMLRLHSGGRERPAALRSA